MLAWLFSVEAGRPWLVDFSHGAWLVALAALAVGEGLGELAVGEGLGELVAGVEWNDGGLLPLPYRKMTWYA